MKKLYGWLLRLCPPEFQSEYGEEVMAVFSARLEEPEGRGLFFLGKEMLGILKLALVMRVSGSRSWPVVAGLGVAAGLHLLLYSLVGVVLRKTSALFESANAFGTGPNGEAITVGIWALFCVLSLMPVFFVLAFRLQAARR